MLPVLPKDNSNVVLDKQDTRLPDPMTSLVSLWLQTMLLLLTLNIHARLSAYQAAYWKLTSSTSKIRVELGGISCTT